MLRELGLGMLFLLAGYEIEVEELVGRGGRRALCDLAGVSRGRARGDRPDRALRDIHAEVAVAIALTSTALGTLLPILKDSGMLGTRFGRTLMNHGAYGELGPIVAMAVLLGTRGPVASMLVLAAFARSRCWSRLLARLQPRGLAAAARHPARRGDLGPDPGPARGAAAGHAGGRGRGVRAGRGAGRVRRRLHPATAAAGGPREPRAQARGAGLRAADPGLLHHLRDGDRPRGGRRGAGGAGGVRGPDPARPRRRGLRRDWDHARGRTAVFDGGRAWRWACSPRPGCRSSSRSPRSP